MSVNAVEWLKQSPEKVLGPMSPDGLSFAESVQRILRNTVNKNSILSNGQQDYVADCLSEIAQQGQVTSLQLAPLIAVINACHE